MISKDMPKRKKINQNDCAIRKKAGRGNVDEPPRKNADFDQCKRRNILKRREEKRGLIAAYGIAAASLDQEEVGCL